MYQAFYKLTGKPFRLSPDPGFFFPSRGHKRALAYLRYGLKQDEGFVVITGAPGTGKTTLAKILLNEMGDSNVVVAHLTTTQLDSADTLRMVAASFGLRYENLDKAALIKTLESFLLARARERKRALLVIDEAQNLPATSLEELRMLSNMQAGDKALVQTFLLGQDQFKKTLDHKDMEQLRQRVIANFHLAPLAQDESQRYIESRLSQVGWNGDPSFAEIAYEAIHEYTQGVPRRINMLCDRILLYTCMEERHQVTGETVQHVIKELEQEKSGDTVQRLKQTTQAAQESARKAAALKRSQNSTAAVTMKTQELNKNNVKKREVSRIGASEDIEDTLIIRGGKADMLGMEDTLSLKGPEAEQLRKATKVGHKTKAPAGSGKRPDYGTNKGTKKDTSKDSNKNKPKDDPHTTAQIFGNTLTKKKPAHTAAGGESTPSEISERDLFRVIPGGKQAAPADVGMEKTVQTTKTAAMRQTPNTQTPPSAEDVVLRRILRLVLAFHRSPSRFPGLDSSNQPLPEGITELLELAVSDDQTLTQVSPAAVMGISPVMLRAAVRFFVRRSLFIVNADDYRVLGLQPGADQAQIEKHYDLLMRLLRQDKQRGSADSIERIGQAYETLSRIDHAVQTSRIEQTQKFRAPEGIEVEDDKSEADSSNRKLHGVIEVNDDLTFDFTDTRKEPVFDDGNSMLSRISENFAFSDDNDGITRKRMRYAGQMAVLGFGALVVVVGLYIVQIGPSEDKSVASNEAQVVAQAGSDIKPEKPIHSETEMNATFADIADSDDSKSSNQKLSEEQESTQSDIADLLKKMEARRMKIRDSRNERKQREEAAQALEVASEAEAQSELRASADNTNTSVNTNKKAQGGQSSGLLGAITSESTASETGNAQASAADSGMGFDGETLDDQQGVVASEANDRKVVKLQPSTSPRLVPSPRLAPNSRAQSRIVAKSIGSSSGGQTRPLIRPATPRPTQIANATVAPRIPPTVVPTNKLTPQTSAPGGKAITEVALNGVINNFSKAYQAGNIDMLTSLFSVNARTNNQTSAVGIRTDYLELFQNTGFRAMSFPEISWENQGPNRVRGLGTYQARISPKGSSVSKLYTGKLTMRVEKINNQLKITQFYFTEDNVETSGNKATAQAKPAGSNVSQKEVDRFISTFVEKYEKGSLEPLMSMFAKDARTNDQTSLEGIRKDHRDLFATTAARQMFLKNMDWHFTDNRVVGKGDFEVLVQSKNSSEFVSYTGKINLKLRKVNGGLKLTHLLHNTQ